MNLSTLASLQVLYNRLNLGSDVCSMPEFRRLLGTNIAVGDNGLAWQAENAVAKLVGGCSGMHLCVSGVGTRKAALCCNCTIIP